jgi:hypothetical protein
MKIGNYIFEILPRGSYNIQLNTPYTNHIWYNNPSSSKFGNLTINHAKPCTHIKPDTGTRYKILGLYWDILIVKQIN